MTTDTLDKILQWRRDFELPVRETITFPDEAEQKLSTNLIKEELAEYTQAWRRDDMAQIADACGDLLFVVMQAIAIHGLDVKRVVDTVLESNYTKLCDTQWEAEGFIHANYYGEAYAKQMRNGKWGIFRLSDNKLLKGPHFKEPDWGWVR